jgi:hypothetical protein
MMTADLTSGDLDWNSILFKKDEVDEIKGKGKKTGLKLSREAVASKTAESDLDDLVRTMSTKESIPGNVETARASGTRKTKVDAVIPKYTAPGYTRPAKGGRDPVSDELERIALKYGTTAPTKRGLRRIST